MTDKTCVECGRPAKDKYRKLCWSCTNYRKRGTTYAEVLTQRHEKEKECGVCGKVTRRWQLYGRKATPVCVKCFEALCLFRDPEWQYIAKCLVSFDENFDTTP